jgi:DNA repair protein RadC
MKKRIYDIKIKMVKESSALYSTNEITNPDCAADIIRQYLDGVDREHFLVLCLNTKNRVIAINTVSIGSLNASITHPREVFKGAILANAAGIILAHNHPSNDTHPSREDIISTERMIKAGRILDMPVLDHIIVGCDDDHRYTSLKDKGII